MRGSTESVAPMILRGPAAMIDSIRVVGGEALETAGILFIPEEIGDAADPEAFKEAWTAIDWSTTPETLEITSVKPGKFTMLDGGTLDLGIVVCQHNWDRLGGQHDGVLVCSECGEVQE